MKIDNIEYSQQIEMLKNQIDSNKINNLVTKDAGNNESVQSDFTIQIASLKTQLDEGRLHAGISIYIHSIMMPIKTVIRSLQLTYMYD
jgi:hypothetical protein